MVPWPENLEVAEECSLSFRNRDVGDLQAKLEHLLANPDVVQSYGERARRHIQQHYSWDNVAESTASLYREMVAKR